MDFIVYIKSIEDFKNNINSFYTFCEECVDEAICEGIYRDDDIDNYEFVIYEIICGFLEVFDNQFEFRYSDNTVEMKLTHIFKGSRKYVKKKQYQNAKKHIIHRLRKFFGNCQYGLFSEYLIDTTNIKELQHEISNTFNTDISHLVINYAF